MKVIVAHPGKQHSLQTALAFQEHNSLFAYITSVYNKKHSKLYYLKFLISKKQKLKANNRRNQELPDNKVIQFCEFSSLLLLLISKFHVHRIITDYLNQSIQKRFAKKVASYVIKNNIDVVIMYDTTIYTAFDLIHKFSPNTLCILDTTIASRAFIRETYENDLKLFPNSGLKKEQSYLWYNKSWMERYNREFQVADYCLVGSEFVKKSITRFVKDENKIIKIPYGVNLKQFKNSERDFLNGPLHLLFVGGIIRRKGIHHLLKVISQYSSKDIILHLAGAYNPTDTLYKEYKNSKNIIFEGFVTRDVISEIYNRCHVFILPSLAEGMAMVGLEALASGLPVICSENTGLDDVIIEGKNGFKIPASNEICLKEKVDFCLHNRKNLYEMSRMAAESVNNYSWEEYRKHLYNSILHLKNS